MQEMGYSPLNMSTRDKLSDDCFIDVPVLLLRGEGSTLLSIAVTNVLLMLTAIWGNVSILLSFVLSSSLRSTSNFLLLGLALTDLGVGLVVHPLYVLVLLSLYNNSIPPCAVVAVYSISTSFLAGLSLLYITVIGTDRYLALRLNLRYREYITERWINTTQIVMWVTNALLCLVWLEGFEVYSTLAAVVVALSLFLTFTIYIKLYAIVKRHKAQIHSQMLTQTAQFDLARSKRLRKSAVNTFYVFFTFLLCYLPFFVATAINNMSSTKTKEGVAVYEFTTTLMLCNSSLNPLMYCLRLREFRNALSSTYRKIFCLD